jgi:hypothetical protein
MWPYLTVPLEGHIRQVWLYNIYTYWWFKKFSLWSLHEIISITSNKHDTDILLLISAMTVYWHHFDKSSINILSLICFTRNGFLITSPISLMRYCSEKSILAKQINVSIYFFFQLTGILQMLTEWVHT